MYVKDLEVGAMYRIKKNLDGRSFCCYKSHESLVYVGRGSGGYGNKMIYLGTKVVEHKKGIWERRHKKNILRLGLFGDKIKRIDPCAWKYIEPMEET